MQHHRVAPLQNLRVCDSGVGHVGVDPTATHPAGPSPCPSSDGFVVSDVGVTEGEIVHAALQIELSISHAVLLHAKKLCTA